MQETTKPHRITRPSRNRCRHCWLPTWPNSWAETRPKRLVPSRLTRESTDRTTDWWMIARLFGFIHPSIHPFTHPTIHSSIHHPPIYVFNHSSIHSLPVTEDAKLQHGEPVPHLGQRHSYGAQRISGDTAGEQNENGMRPLIRSFGRVASRAPDCLIGRPIFTRSLLGLPTAWSFGRASNRAPDCLVVRLSPNSGSRLLVRSAEYPIGLPIAWSTRRSSLDPYSASRPLDRLAEYTVGLPTAWSFGRAGIQSGSRLLDGLAEYLSERPNFPVGCPEWFRCFFVYCR